MTPAELVEIAGEQWYVDTEKPRHECGVFAIYAPGRNVARLTATAIHELQHRGDAAAGVAVISEQGFKRHSGIGTAGQVFTTKSIEQLHGDSAIGHCRFATTGAADVEHNEHPFMSPPGHPECALAHNGNLTNRETLLQDIASRGITPKGTTDTEIAAAWISICPAETWEKRIQAFMVRAEGSYSMALLTKEGVFAFRDPAGNRPLQLGKIDGGWVVSSETGVFPIIDAHKRREIREGEIIRIDAGGYRTVSHRPARRLAACVFEHVYFSRGDSYLDGEYVDEVRREIGRQQAYEDIRNGTVPDVDVISGVPYTGLPMGKGYAEVVEKPFDDVLLPNRYGSMRTFIKPKNAREAVERKFNVLVNVVKKYPRIGLWDDSNVKGNTAPPLEQMLTKAGATEVHWMIGSPKIIADCDYGVNMGNEEELIAYQRTTEEIRQMIGGHSLQFMSPETLLTAIEMEFGETCMKCFTGVVPFETADHPHAIDELPEEFTAAQYEGSARP